jgi:hypothetical protein
VTAETVSPTAEHRGPDPAHSLHSADRFKLALGAIVAAQAIWLGVLMGRGWYYQADFANLADAANHNLSWSYLTLSVGGHLGIPGRVVLWLLAHFAPLNYPLTIVARLIAQAAATVLLGRLLVVLVGRRPGVLVVLALYAFSPFLLQGTLWLSPAIGLLGSQLCALFALHCHVRYALDRRLRSAVGAAAGIFGATLLAEQAAVTALILPILSIAFLHAGSLRQRMRSTLSCWPEWVLIASPIIAFLVYFFAVGDYGKAAHGLSLSDVTSVVGVDWGASMAPGLLGGPWRWYSGGNNYLGLADPALAVRIGCLCAIVALVALGVRRTGWRAVAAWSMPAITSAVGIVIVAAGRFGTLGVAIAKQFEHAFFSAVPAALAVCLALWPSDPEQMQARLHGAPDEARSASVAAPGSRRRLVRVPAAAAVLALAAGSVISGITYTQIWARNPARSYVQGVEHSLGRTRAKIALYDTAIPSSLLPLETTNYVSDLLTLTGQQADFGYATTKPKIIDDTGHAVPARFFVHTRVDLSGAQFCRYPVRGTATVTKPFQHSARSNDWYLQLEYFQQHASVVDVALIGSDGEPVAPDSGTRVLLRTRLGRVHLLFRATTATSIRIRGVGSETNVCFTAALLGFPFPQGRTGQ